MQISKEFLFDFAFMHPTTLKLMNLNIGDSFCVTCPTTNMSLIVTCWPSAQINQSHISICKQYLLINGFCLEMTCHLLAKKHALKTNHQIAKNLNLKFEPTQSTCDPFVAVVANENNDEKQTNDLKLIVSFLKEIHRKKFLILSETQHLFLNYMGQLLVFKLVGIDGIGGSGERKSLKKSSIDSLVKDLNNLSFEKSDTKHFVDVNLKPVEYLDLDNLKQHLNSFQVVETTNISLLENIDEKSLTENVITLNDIGGLEKEIEMLREFFINPFKYAELYKKIGREYFCLSLFSFTKYSNNKNIFLIKKRC